MLSEFKCRNLMKPQILTCNIILLAGIEPENVSSPETVVTFLCNVHIHSLCCKLKYYEAVKRN
jgi:hypothetical protein